MIRSTRLAALALAAGLALTACTPERIGAAAIVGDERISVSQLQGTVDDFAATVPNAPEFGTLDLGELQRKLLQEQINHRLYQHIARQRGIEISEAEIDAQIATLREQTGGDEEFAAALAGQGWTEQVLRDIVYDQLVSQRLGGAEQAQQALDAAAKELGVWVSPRYGTWSNGTLQAGSGSLSQPEPQEQGTAEPTPGGPTTGQ